MAEKRSNRFCSAIVSRWSNEKRPAEAGRWCVAHTGFEPVISALRGRCPWPLDECAAALRTV